MKISLYPSVTRMEGSIGWWVAGTTELSLTTHGSRHPHHVCRQSHRYPLIKKTLPKRNFESKTQLEMGSGIFV